MNTGYLKINVYGNNIASPLKGAEILINEKIYKTNNFGKTEKIKLETIDKKYSLYEQKEVLPFKTYDIEIICDGFLNKTIKKVEIFEDETTMLDVYLKSIDYEVSYDIDVPLNTLFGTYPNTIIEISSSPKILKEVLIPEYIIVHDGNPNDTSASEYKVNFIDYIKNVASSEIYSTWPNETIKANVIAIISFTMNRIFTEWYKSRGYNFTITSTTTYDQKYSHGRPIFEKISNIVDEYFNIYIKSGNGYPLLAQYRSNTTTPGVMSQWGSKDLGDIGYDYKYILEYYYKNISIGEAQNINYYPSSFSKDLKIGDCSDEVYSLENQLNYIRGSYPGLPAIENANGVYDDNTKNAVSVFQNVFNLPITGVVDYKTWYKISYIFVAVNDLIKSIYY